MRRAVSRWEIVGFSINDVIGSGVYLLPAAAAAILGAASVGAVVLAGFAVLLLVLCFAEAGSYFDRPGSAYVYTREAFGELVGFEVGWMTWLARVASVSSLSVGFARALGYLWPAANVGWGRGLAIVLPVLVLTGINVIGVKSGVRTAVFLAITKTLPLLLFIFVGIFYVSTSLATSVAAKPGSGTLGDAVLLLLFAYAGFENTAAPAGEFKNPRRDVPFALIVQIVIVTLIYTGVQWVALGTLPGVVESQTPLADAAARFLGSGGGLLMTVGGVISILGTNSNTVLSGPRYLFALAQDGFGPRFLRGCIRATARRRRRSCCRPPSPCRSPSPVPSRRSRRSRPWHGSPPTSAPRSRCRCCAASCRGRERSACRAARRSHRRRAALPRLRGERQHGEPDRRRHRAGCRRGDLRACGEGPLPLVRTLR